MIISSTNNAKTCIICFWYAFFISISSAKDSLTTGEIIKDGAEYLESSGKTFQLGFFKMGSVERYVGIWYAMDPKTVVWVANRDSPVLDSTGVLTVMEDGELQVLDEKRKDYFHTDAGGSPRKMLKLFDTGNAVLIDMDSNSTAWESFKHPTDTFLPGMKMDMNIKLTSWKNPDDPGTGTLVFQQEETRQFSIVNSTDESTRWRSGTGSKKNFEPYQMNSKVYKLLSNTTTQINCKSNLIPNCRETPRYATYDYSRLLMNYTGSIQFYTWAEPDKQWSLDWEEPGADVCSIHQVCGQFGLCSPTHNKKCSCLPGFKPVAPEDPSAGCKRTNDDCDKNNKFIDIRMIKLATPATRSFLLDNDTECKKMCLQKCQCRAYSYRMEDQWQIRSGGTYNCWIWDWEMYNLQTNGKDNIAVRISGTAEDYLDPGKDPRRGNRSSFITKTKVLIFAITILLILLVCILGYTYYKRLVVRQQGRNHMFQMDNNERWATDLLDLERPREDDTESIGIPFVQFESILTATDNFSDANKLGEGGFGPVYKGKLPGGQEVAVKRLSSLSGQGLQEFRNEVILIAKLQHRNLVRLLGYCMKGNEKILLYEYMPNKSLDAFIFDQTPSISLDWAKRYEIILGIARGLLYLHQDSRLRIIHRDLKTSNILLDEDLNPKISDFGLAKIIEGREIESSTNRVIGTYGYMAPEYALDGLYSIKSDVFSFGVVVLEIISGKKNTVSSQLQQNLSLLRYAWSLWKEDMPFELMDQRLLESSNSNEVLKCIIVGLLCV